MSLVRVTTLVILAAVIGAGVAYALVELLRPDDPAAVAPVVIDPSAGTQRTAATTAPRTTPATQTATTTRPAAPTTRTEPGDDHGGWQAGAPIQSEDHSGKGSGRSDDDRDDREDREDRDDRDDRDDDSSGRGGGDDD
jgi:Rieske Fe-S protein